MTVSVEIVFSDENLRISQTSIKAVKMINLKICKKNEALITTHLVAGLRETVAGLAVRQPLHDVIHEHTSRAVCGIRGPSWARRCRGTYLLSITLLGTWYSVSEKTVALETFEISVVFQN